MNKKTIRFKTKSEIRFKNFFQNLSLALRGQKIDVEVASKGILDLPPEILTQINKYLPLQDEKHFREVCLGCPVLRKAYNDKIQELGIMRVHLCNEDYLVKFVNDIKFLVHSNLKISLELPPKYDVDVHEILNPALIQLVDKCQDRILHLQADYVVPSDINEKVLPKLTKLKKIQIISRNKIHDELFLQLIENNCDSVEKLELFELRFTDGVTFSEFKNLTDIEKTQICMRHTG